jgi:hypothetical protein
MRGLDLDPIFLAKADKQAERLRDRKVKARQICQKWMVNPKMDG